LDLVVANVGKGRLAEYLLRLVVAADEAVFADHKDVVGRRFCPVVLSAKFVVVLNEALFLVQAVKPVVGGNPEDVVFGLHDALNQVARQAGGVVWGGLVHADV
jgi:hypothetical protein